MMQGWAAFAAFMMDVDRATRDLNLRPHQDVFYRGHRDNTFRLLPSLLRQACNNAEDLWRLERRVFLHFRAAARELYSSERTDWDVLFHMQHHGVPTRLLDWTSVFSVALYFALLDFQDDSTVVPCIWLLNPYAMNKAVWHTHNLFRPKYLARDERNNRSYDYGELLVEAHRGERSQSAHMRWGRLPWDRPLAIYDSQRSERMYAQNGFFTIHGTDLAPLEKIFENAPNLLTKVDIPREIVPVAKQFLVLAGIGHRQLFPGLDGVSKSIKERFVISR